MCPPVSMNVKLLEGTQVVTDTEMKFVLDKECDEEWNSSWLRCTQDVYKDVYKCVCVCMCLLHFPTCQYSVVNSHWLRVFAIRQHTRSLEVVLIIISTLPCHISATLPAGSYKPFQLNCFSWTNVIGWHVILRLNQSFHAWHRRRNHDRGGWSGLLII